MDEYGMMQALTHMMWLGPIAAIVLLGLRSVIYARLIVGVLYGP
jgi:hypothetical protein